MRPSKGVAVVEHVMVVADVERAEAQVPFLSERFADGDIHRRVRGQVSGAIAIEKSGTVVHVHGGPTAPRKLEVRSRTERIALVVIEEEISLLRRREVGEPTGDRSCAFGILMRVGQMELNSTGNSRRVGAYFPSTETGAVDGQREEDVGIPEHVVIEKVSGCRAEIGDIERPGRQRNRESELPLFVTLSVERQKSAVRSVALREQ